MDFFNDREVSILLLIALILMSNVVAKENEENRTIIPENTLQIATESITGELRIIISPNETKSRVKRQLGGYDPYYNRRRPYPPIIFGGVGLGGFGGYGFGRGFGGRGFGGRGFGGRGFGGGGFGGRGFGGGGFGGRGFGGGGFGGRGFGGRGFGGRGIGGRGIGGFGGGRGGGRG